MTFDLQQPQRIAAGGSAGSQTQLIQSIRQSNCIAFFINAALHLTYVWIICMGSISGCTKLFVLLRKRKWFSDEENFH